MGGLVLESHPVSSTASPQIFCVPLQHATSLGISNHSATASHTELQHADAATAQSSPLRINSSMAATCSCFLQRVSSLPADVINLGFNITFAMVPQSYAALRCPALTVPSLDLCRSCSVAHIPGTHCNFQTGIKSCQAGTILGVHNITPFGQW